ncbi:MAG: peptidylprolyl isomerase [Rubricoccaceae bacterium]
MSPRSAPRRARALSLAVALATALGACATTAPPPAGNAPDALAGRAPDGLLDRPDLQALVDAQVLRAPAPLVEALGHADPVVRARAAFALGSVQHAPAADALVRALGDDEPAVRADAAFALGQLADSTAGVFLVSALRTEGTASVQRELLDALGKAGGQADLAALVALPLAPALEPYRSLALARLFMRGQTSPEATAHLLGELRQPDAARREQAAYAFVRVPPAAWAAYAPAVRAATDALAPGDGARIHLARALGRLRDGQDVPRLAAMGAAPDWRIRQGAAAALGPLAAQDAAAREALFAALDDRHVLVGQTAAQGLAAATLPPADVARAAAWIAAHPSDRSVAGALLPALARAGRAADVEAWLARQTDPFARAAAVRALADAPDADGLDRLFAAAADADARVAFAALSALATRWDARRAAASDAEARRFYDAFAAGLARRDLATTSAAAPPLADARFAPLGGPALLRQVYASLRAPEDLEPMVEIVRAVGKTRDGEEMPFLVGVALGGHPVLRAAARDALNDRLEDGIDIELTGENAPQTVLVEWDYLARLGPRPLLTLETTRGLIVVEMDAEAAPQTVQALARTAERGLYDGVPFHRVVPGFVVQGGDHFRADGYGGPAVSLRSEFTRLRFETGVAGMASAGKDTEGVQFFFMHAPAPHLDGRYTAFGRVVRGQDVVDRLVQGDVVRRARIGRRPAR